MSKQRKETNQVIWKEVITDNLLCICDIIQSYLFLIYLYFCCSHNSLLFALQRFDNFSRISKVLCILNLDIELKLVSRMWLSVNSCKLLVCDAQY